MNNLQSQANSWLSPLLTCQDVPQKGGYGVYSVRAIAKGTLLAMFGGTVITGDRLNTISAELRSLSIQVDDNLFLVSTVSGPGDRVNHSCDPNAGMNGQIGLIAMRDIEPGEEVTFDYAMCDSAPYDEFECACGSSHCREYITGNDWMLPHLQSRYQGYFSPYLQRKITARRNRSGGKVAT